MPSFDVVSEVDLQEVRNAVDQANREVDTRFDFKGTGANFEQKEADITLHGQNDFQLKQMMDILEKKLVKRNVELSMELVRAAEKKAAREKLPAGGNFDSLVELLLWDYLDRDPRFTT